MSALTYFGLLGVARMAVERRISAQCKNQLASEYNPANVEVERLQQTYLFLEWNAESVYFFRDLNQ